MQIAKLLHNKNYTMRLIITFLFTAFIFSISSAQFIEHVFTYDSDDYPFINEISLADMDGDGDLDYVTLGNQNRTITVAYNNDFISEPNLVSFKSPEALWNMVLHDFDQDGDVDIIGSAPFEDKSIWWSNEGSGIFMEKDFLIADYNSLLFTDMNGDGIVDMIAEVDDALIIFDVNNGTVSQREQVDSDSFGFNYKALTTFDKDNDGFPEILTADAFDGIILYEQSSADNFTKIELLPDVFSVEKLEVSDINGDGNFDIIASSKFNGTSKVQINQGDGTFVEENIEPQSERISFSKVIDFDSDGDDDIIYYDTGFGIDGTLYVYNNTNGNFAREAMSLDHTRLENGAVGDINGDGYLDMVFGNNPFFETALVIFENVGVLSVKENPDFPYEIYPSIVTKSVTIKTENEVQYRIVDQVGSVVIIGKNLGANLISLENLNSGTYFIQLQLDNMSVAQRILKVAF